MQSKDLEDNDAQDDEESLRCLKFLVEAGANVNACDSLLQTPLHHACTTNNINIVRVLLGFPEITVDVSKTVAL